MKITKFLLFGICMAGLLYSCTTRPSASIHTNEHGTRWQWGNDTILIETLQRPEGQKSVIGLAVPKMEVVRVGFVGLGASGAVERFTSIPGVHIVALCGYEQASTDNCLSSLQKASLPKAAVYFGKKGYEQLCKRDDIDLVYITADWSHHSPVAMCALENGKHVAIESPSAIILKECWDLVNMSEKTRKQCIPCVEFSMDSRLIYCFQNGLPLDMDVYDLAEWCCRSELDSLSINNDHAVVIMPDFTRGERNAMKRCKPAYATPEDEVASMEKAQAFTVKLKEQGAKEWAVE